MFFRGHEKHSVLSLDVDAAKTGELTAGTLVSGHTNLSVEDRVEQFFEQFREPMVRYLSATFGSERVQAEEITQEAFLQLYRYMLQGHPIDNVRAWTYRVARNIALQRVRSQEFLSPLSDEEWSELQSSIADKAPNPEENVLEKERLARLRSALGRLTAVERECLNGSIIGCVA